MSTCRLSSSALVKKEAHDPNSNEPFAGAFRDVFAALDDLERKSGRSKRLRQTELARRLTAFGMLGRYGEGTKQQSVSSWLKSDGSECDEPHKLIAYLRTTDIKSALVDALERTLPVQETVDKPSNVEQLYRNRRLNDEAHRPLETQGVPREFEGFTVREIGRHSADGGLILITSPAASPIDAEAPNSPKEYAFRHSGNEMNPRHKQGELLFISSSQDRRAGDSVVVYLPCEGEGQRFFVREYVEEGDGGITVKTIKGQVERTFAWTEIAATHLVIGSSYKS